MVKCSEADHRLIVIVGGGAAGATAAEVSFSGIILFRCNHS